MKLAEAPYPRDTRAKGWRFELDYEKIEQSDTWSLATSMAFDGLPLARPLLLAMWYAAWKQVPCGSLPSDDALIAASIGIPQSIFAEYRTILMRGWWAADDGRMYHETLTQRVLEMLSSKDAERARKADWRARKSRDVQRDTCGTDAVVTPESHGSDDTGTGTGTIEEISTPSGSRAPRKRKPHLERPDSVDAQVWGDWLQLRAKKRAPVTATVLAGASSEAEKAGIPLEAFLRIWCTRGSQGLEADWLKASERAVGMSFDQQRVAEKRNEVAKWTGGLLGKTHPENVIDMEDANAQKRLG